MATSAKTKRATKAAAEPATEIVAYKGFGPDLSCRGFKYEIGGAYTHTGSVVQCESGFHVCQNPLDVLDYYPLINDNGSSNRFCRVAVGGKIDRSDDRKWAAAELTVNVELSLPEFIKAGDQWIMAAAKSGEGVTVSDKRADKLAASGDSSQLAASGYSSKLEITGSKSAAAAVGPGSSIKAAAGTPIAICEYDSSGKPIGFATGIAGQDGVPADVWLIARHGKLVERS